MQNKFDGRVFVLKMIRNAVVLRFSKNQEQAEISGIPELSVHPAMILHPLDCLHCRS